MEILNMPLQFTNPVNVVTASCGNMELQYTANIAAQIGELITTHNRLVAVNSIVHFILGTDFMKSHGITIDIKNVSIHTDSYSQIWPSNNNCVVYSVVAIFHDNSEDLDYNVPLFNKPQVYTLPNCPPVYKTVLNSCSELFLSFPGKTITS